MKSYYLRHKVKEGDITNLSDSISELIISENRHREEDLITVETPNGIFTARVTFIDKAAVEVEIIKKEMDKEAGFSGITIIQSVSNDAKFTYFIEKSVELGVSRIIPVVSEYSLLDLKGAHKKEQLWNKVIRDATEQSRNPKPTVIDKPVMLEELPPLPGSDPVHTLNLILTTEEPEAKGLEQIELGTAEDFLVAIGPEAGWSSGDLKIFRDLNFKPIQLKGNILRTETIAPVITAIIRYSKGDL